MTGNQRITPSRELSREEERIAELTAPMNIQKFLNAGARVRAAEERIKSNPEHCFPHDLLELAVSLHEARWRKETTEAQEERLGKLNQSLRKQNPSLTETQIIEIAWKLENENLKPEAERREKKIVETFKKAFDDWKRTLTHSDWEGYQRGANGSDVERVLREMAQKIWEGYRKT